jgi:hypothetical protein
MLAPMSISGMSNRPIGLISVPIITREDGRYLSFELLTGLTHPTDYPDCQFTNAVGLAQFDGLFGDEVSADADRKSRPGFPRFED